MLKHPKVVIADNMRLLRPRAWIILSVAAISMLAGFLLSYMRTPKYTSHSLIGVENRGGGGDQSEQEEIRQRVLKLEKEVLNREHLQPVIERAGLGGAGKDLDHVVAAIQRNTKLELVSTNASRTGIGDGIAASTATAAEFDVSFTAASPQLAQQICRAVTSTLLEQALRSGREAAQNPATSPSKELEEAKRKLEQAEAKLSAFKQERPAREGKRGSKSSAALYSQLDATKQAIHRAQQDKAYIESLLAQQLALRKSADTSNGDKANPAEPPEIRQLRLQVRQSEEAISRSTREEKRLQDEIKRDQKRDDGSSEREEQSKQLTQDVERARKVYEDILASTTNAEAAAAGLPRQPGEQITLVHPADLPTSPSSPNRRWFIGGGLVSGLILGFWFALGAKSDARAICTQADLEVALGAPVLVCVPWVGRTDHSSQAFSDKNSDETAEIKGKESIPV